MNKNMDNLINKNCEKQRKEIDDLTWNFVYYSWQEARILYDRSNETKEKD